MPLDSTNWPHTATETDETTALLVRARGFIERGWCQDALARDATGKVVGYRYSRAIEWCAVGALGAANYVSATYVDGTFQSALDRLEAAVGGENICMFNNRQETVEPVLAAFDRAIAGEPAARITEEASS